MHTALIVAAVVVVAVIGLGIAILRFLSNPDNYK